jgi:uncharacterized protein (DUF488 family)
MYKRGEAVILYTLGYERRTIEEFVVVLASVGADVLVDIRDVAWSHKRDFAKSALQAHLAANGIAYVHARFAGNPKRLRARGGTSEELLAAYARHLDDHPEIVEEFRELISDLAKDGRRPCIMCFERDPRDCHRSVLAERWKGGRRGARVEHLGATAPT